MALKNYFNKKYIKKRLLQVLLPYLATMITRRKFFVVKYQSVILRLSSLLWDEDIIYHHFHAYQRSRDHFSDEKNPEERDSVNVAPDTTLYIDIGGYNGVYGLLVAKINPHTKVHIFEPNPLSAYVIYRNAELNNLSNVTLHHVAVGDVNGLMPLRIQKNGSRVELGLKNSFTVRCMTLDSLMASLVDADFANVFMKIDAEGFDKQCLEGARQFMNKCKKLKMILSVHAPEIIKLHNYTNDDVYKTVRDCGLRITKQEPSATNITLYLEK